MPGRLRNLGNRLLARLKRTGPKTAKAQVTSETAVVKRNSEGTKVMSEPRRREIIGHLTTLNAVDASLASTAVKLWDEAVARREEIHRTPKTLEIIRLGEGLQQTVVLKHPDTKHIFAELLVNEIKEYAKGDEKRTFISLEPRNAPGMGSFSIPCEEIPQGLVSKPFGRSYTKFPLRKEVSRFQGHFVVNYEETPKGKKPVVYFINFGHLSCK